MTELDRQIQATLQTLVALQGAKVIQLERENAALKKQVEMIKRTEAARRERKEAQA